MREPLRSLDLCSGAGGLALGLHHAGFRHEALLELDPAACDTLTLNGQSLGVTTPVTPSDIKTFNFKAFRALDLLSAGVPCQPFSQAGKHLGHVDDRNLFPVVVRATREIAPRAVLIENVYALLRPRFSEFFEYLLRQLQTPEVTRRSDERWQSHLRRLRRQQGSNADLGLTYRVTWAVLQAADYGVPQLRSRVFVVALRDDVGATWVPPNRDQDLARSLHTREALQYAQWISGEYWRDHDLPRLKSVPASARAWVRLHTEQPKPIGRPWRTVRDALRGLPEPIVADGPMDDHVRQPGARSYDGHSGSHWDWPSKTIKAGVHGVAGGENMLRHANGKVRYFTVREAARLQAFPDAYAFGGCRWGQGLRQLGNAVPVKLAEVVGSQIANALGGAATNRKRRAA